MTEENKEVIEEVTEETTEQPVEEAIEQVIDETKFTSAGDDSVRKIDLDVAPPSQEVEAVKEETPPVEKPQEVEQEKVEPPIIEEVNAEDKVEAPVENNVETTQVETPTEKVELPENIQKVVEFINETGGNLNDYVSLNRDISSMEDSDVLSEYYKTTKSHLSSEERSFLMEDRFGVDEEIDDEREKRKKQIALKEQVAEARAYLDGQKSKYYEEIKAGSKLTPEQQEAIEFFNRHNKDQEDQKKITEDSKRTFLNKTDSFFGQDFKGFEYNVGDKKYRFNVKDVDKIKKTQSDLNNFVNKFVGDDNSTIEDAAGYHKSLYTAMNADAVAKHFYEQGKADAIKGQVASDKNINLEPRKTHGETQVGGIKYKVLGDSSADIKNRSFKIKKKN